MRREWRKWEDGEWCLRVGAVRVSYVGRTYRYGPAGTRRYEILLGRKFSLRWGF